VLSWEDFLLGRRALPPDPGALLRIESPGENATVERLLLRRGEEEQDERFDCPRTTAEGYRQDYGRIRNPRQVYLGFRAVLREISATGIRTMNPASDIAIMTDKPSCHERLVRFGVSRPPVLGYPRSYDELRPIIERAPRLFIKLANGSSASGVVAFQTDGNRQLAITTVEREDDRLYNSRRLRRYTDATEIRRILDLLCQEGVLVEAWIPKAGWNGATFDLRVIVIGGRSRHVAVRMSRSPITNLHLGNGNRRGDPDGVRVRLGEDRWTAAMHTSAQALAAFPQSLYAGVDLLVSSDGRRTYIAEVNAFGDLVRRTWVDGRDPYEMELLTAMEGVTA
jgi:glutathione synthase/RimK-type ligase-like ATP-grasp enzyme